MAIEFPKINGHRYSWASVTIKSSVGMELIHIKEISYSHKLEPGLVRGTGAQPSGRTRGEYEAEGSFVLQREQWDEYRNKLGDGYMETAVDISVSYAEDGSPVVTDELKGVRITSVENGPSQGTDALEVSCDLSIMYVLEGGKKPLKRMRL
jgi:hypothetical protein